MNRTCQSTNCVDHAAKNYQEFFVPAIGSPVARDLLARARLKPGKRVLDVACGTGVVTRLAAEGAGPAGKVAGLDPNPGMLAVARASTPLDLPIEWIEASAEAMPLADGACQVALCQMGLQFVPNKLAALREMRRVLAPGGRAHVNLPGPMPRPFAIMAEGLARHMGQEAATFAELVFSLHEPGELRDLFESSGFNEIDIEARPKRLVVPPPEEFLWQYIHSTPLAQAAMAADERVRNELERVVCAEWAEYAMGDTMQFEVGMTTVSAVR